MIFSEEECFHSVIFSNLKPDTQYKWKVFFLIEFQTTSGKIITHKNIRSQLAIHGKRIMVAVEPMVLIVYP